MQQVFNAFYKILDVWSSAEYADDHTFGCDQCAGA